MNNHQAEKFWNKNYNTIISNELLDDSNIHQFKVRKPSAFQCTYTLVEVITLSLNKYLINRVIFLAEDIGCIIYYQHIDFINIRCEDIPHLSKVYKQEYEYELINPDIYQFHIDFDKDEKVYSTL